MLQYCTGSPEEDIAMGDRSVGSGPLQGDRQVGGPNSHRRCMRGGLGHADA
jgi:hypothetical protein